MNNTTLDKTFTKTHEMTGKCPFGGDRVGGAFGTPPTLENWYPDRLRVELLHQNGLSANPLGADFDYAAEFAKLDFQALKSPGVCCNQSSTSMATVCHGPTSWF